MAATVVEAGMALEVMLSGLAIVDAVLVGTMDTMMARHHRSLCWDRQVEDRFRSIGI